MLILMIEMIQISIPMGPQVIEALADGAVMMGLPRALATEQVEKNKQTIDKKNQRNRQKH